MKPFALLAALSLASAPSLARAADDKKPIQIVEVLELSGNGASTGVNMRNAVELAAKEINAAGGILGRPVEITALDTQTNPSVAKALAQKAIDMGAYVVIGPIFSGSTIVSMTETRRAEIPNFTGGEAANLTMQGNPYIFRTSLTQKASMPKVARYLRDGVKAKTVSLLWVNDDFGKGGRDEIKKALEGAGVKVAADLVTDPGQVDFSGPVLKVKQAGAEAAFVYLHEEESARIIKEFRKQGYDKPIVGETVIIDQKVIALAGEGANGIFGHVGLTVDAPIAGIKAYDEKYLKAYGFRSDHNGLKGYITMYLIKAVTEKIGKVDGKAFAAALHGMCLKAKDHPGLLMDVCYDQNGDLDRDSFLVEVKGLKQVVTEVLPPLGKK
jgi:branched-chain amino acid transport system substrate-binding protein